LSCPKAGNYIEESDFFDFFFDFVVVVVVAELSVLDGAVALASGAGAAEGSVAGAAGTGAVLSVVGDAGVGAGIVDCGDCGAVGAGEVCAIAAPETPINIAAAIGRIFIFFSPCLHLNGTRTERMSGVKGPFIMIVASPIHNESSR
jgi:hypothetical protein